MKISINQAAGAATLLARLSELQAAIDVVQAKGSYPVELRLPGAGLTLAICNKEATIRYLIELQAKVIAGLKIEFGIIVDRQETNSK